MLNTMLWLARSGAAWADIPERYGPHQSVRCNAESSIGRFKREASFYLHFPPQPLK